MKNLLKTYLQHKLPANENLLNYFDEQMNTYLLAYCSSIYPDSDSKAYVLYGCERGAKLGTVYYSEGLVFYKNALFFTPSHSYSSVSDYEPGFILTQQIITEEYANGSTLPAYSESTLVWNNHVAGELAFSNLVRREFSMKEITATSTFFEKKEAKIINGNWTQNLILKLKLQNAAISSNSTAIYATDFTKTGFLGFGKIMNRTTGQALDVCVYQINSYTIFTRPSDPEQTLVNSSLPKWSDLCAYINMQSGQDVTLYVNVIHERV